MESNLVTGTKQTKGSTLHTLTFSLCCENAEFRDNVVEMIIAALGGAHVGVPEEKKPVLGFQKEDEDGE